MTHEDMRVGQAEEGAESGSPVQNPLKATRNDYNEVSDDGETKNANCIRRLSNRVMPNGGFLSGIFNLAGGSLGAGILALPSAFHATGIIMGTIYLIVIYLLTVYSVQLLAMAAAKTKIRSYEGMARELFGRGGDIFTAIIMFVKCFGACIAYVISIGDLVSAFLKDDSITGFFASTSWNRIVTVIIFLVFMLPLSLPKQINSVRYVSLFGVSFLVYFVICIIVHSAQNGLPERKRDEINLFQTGNEAIRGLGMYMFAYLCQSNMFEVWNEMKPQQSVSRLTKETAIGMLICTVLYWFTAFFGYMDFGGDVESSILRMYRPLREPMMAVAYFGIVVKLCVAFALHILPCRDSAHHLLGWTLDTVPWWKNAVLCTILCGCALVMGLFIPDVDVVFGLLGSFTGGFIAFVFPALFFMYAGDFTLRKVGAVQFFSAYFLLLSGVAAICFGTTSTVYKVIHN